MKLGNDLREIEIPDAVADKVGAKETNQLIASDASGEEPASPRLSVGAATAARWLDWRSGAWCSIRRDGLGGRTEGRREGSRPAD